MNEEIIEEEIDRQIKQEKEERILGDNIIKELKEETPSWEEVEQSLKTSQKELQKVLNDKSETIFSYFTNEEYLYE